jgi:hypothetical protein
VKQKEAQRICLPDPADLLKGLNAKETIKQTLRMQCFPKETWTRLAKAVKSLPLTQDDPLSREVILQELDKKLGTQHALQICCQTQARTSARREKEKVAFLDPGSVKDPRLQRFFKFCSECHLYQDLPYPFLAGEKEELVLQNIRSRVQLIQFRLQNNQMPPHFARLPLNAKDRQALLQSLDEIAK